MALPSLACRSIAQDEQREPYCGAWRAREMHEDHPRYSSV